MRGHPNRFLSATCRPFYRPLSNSGRYNKTLYFNNLQILSRRGLSDIAPKVADIGVDPVSTPPGLSSGGQHAFRPETLKSSTKCPAGDLRPDAPVNL